MDDLKQQIIDLFKNNTERITIHVTHDRFGMRNVAAVFVDGQAISETLTDVTEEVNEAADNYGEMMKPQLYGEW